MLPHEGLAAAYFLVLATAAPLTRGARRRTWSVMLLSVSIGGSVVVASHTLPPGARAWLPHLYLVLGYWVPALLVPPVVESPFERWLRRTDRMWRRPAMGTPTWALVGAELSYLMCYPLVPTGLLVVWIRGTAADLERYWFSVLLAGYLCYSTIPWLVSRPPRLLDDAGDTHGAVASANRFVLRHVSHQLNTFPSGHVAVAATAALAVVPVSWPGSVAMGIVAGGVAVGAIAGRYHYGLDVVLGAIVAIGATLVSWYL